MSGSASRSSHCSHSSCSSHSSRSSYCSCSSGCSHSSCSSRSSAWLLPQLLQLHLLPQLLHLLHHPPAPNEGGTVRHIVSKRSLFKDTFCCTCRIFTCQKYVLVLFWYIRVGSSFILSHRSNDTESSIRQHSDTCNAQ